jgi:hypothetical protein
MTTQPSDTKPEEELQREAEAAKKRLFETIDRIEGKAKTVARAAVDTTRVSGWGVLGAVALWAGVVLLTRRRERRTSTALVLRPEPKRSLPVRLAIMTSRGCAAVLGFVLTREWALRVLGQHRPEVSYRAPVTPQVRQLGATSVPAPPTEGASVWQSRGTPNA